MELSDQIGASKELFELSGEPIQLQPTQLHHLHHLHMEELEELSVCRPTKHPSFMVKYSRTNQIILWLYDNSKGLSDKQLSVKIPDIKAIRQARNELVEKGQIQKIGEQGRKHLWGLTSAGKLYVEEEYEKWSNLEIKSKKQIFTKNKLEAEEANKKASAEALIFTYKDKIAEALRKGVGGTEIDYVELAKINPELMDLLIEEPKNTLKILNMGLQDMDLPGDTKGFHLAINNLPSSAHIPISDLRSKHIGKLLSSDVKVELKSEIRPGLTSAIFECPSCGNKIPVLQIGDRFREPSRCGCGRKGKFRLLDKELIDVCRMNLCQLPKEFVGTRKKPSRCVAIASGSYLTSAHQMKGIDFGSPIRITYCLSEKAQLLRTGGQSTNFDFVLELVHFELLNQNQQLISTKDIDIQQHEEFIKDNDFLEAFANSCYPKHGGDFEIKCALAFLLVSGNYGEYRKHEVFHVGLLGDPSTNKTQLMKRTVKLSPIGDWVVGTKQSASGAGLIASAGSKDPFTNQQLLDYGIIPLNEKGIIGIDEVAELSEEDIKGMNEWLEDQIISINKANINEKLNADSRAIIAANPYTGVLNEYEELTSSAFAIPKQTLSRIHFPFVMRLNHSKETKKLITDMILREKDCTPQSFPDIFILNHILLAKKIKPVLREKDILKLEQFYNDVLDTYMQKESKPLLIGPRLLRAMKALVLCSAKLHLRKCTADIDIQIAGKILKRMLKDWGYEINNLY